MLFQRVFLTTSFLDYSVKTIAMASVYLASNVADSLRQVSEVMVVFHRIKQVEDNE